MRLIGFAMALQHTIPNLARGGPGCSHSEEPVDGILSQPPSNRKGAIVVSFPPLSSSNFFDTTQTTEKATLARPNWWVSTSPECLEPPHYGKLQLCGFDSTCGRYDIKIDLNRSNWWVILFCIELYWTLEWLYCYLSAVSHKSRSPINLPWICLRKNLIYTYFQTHDHSVTDLLITPMHIKHSMYSKVK